MKLHYKGKYDLNPESLPHGEHMPNAVAFVEAKSSKELAKIANRVGGLLFVVFGAIAYIRCWGQISLTGMMLGAGFSFACLFPHEFLHALCFKEDVYLYTNMKQGMLFVVGPETMSKSRFVWMSLAPNLAFGFLPFLLGMLFPHLFFLAVWGILGIGMGAGDYYNVFNALTQMPKGARTYLYQFNSFWYLPE